MLSSVRDRRATFRMLTSVINRNPKKCNKVSFSTVRRSLIKSGMNGRIAVRKPWLLPENIEKRFKFAKLHEHCTIEDWHQVLFSDETKLGLFGTNRRITVRGRAGERPCLLPTFKFGGGSIMIWGCISAYGVGDIKLTECKLNQQG